MSQGSSTALWDNENAHVKRCHPNERHHFCVLSELGVMLGHLLQVPPTSPAITSKDTPLQRRRDSSTCLQQPPLSLPEASGKESSPSSLPEQVWPEHPVSPCHDVGLSCLLAAAEPVEAVLPGATRHPRRAQRSPRT